MSCVHTTKVARRHLRQQTCMGAGVPACAASQHAYLDRHGELIDAILSACRQQAWNRGEGSSSLSGRGRPSCAERPCESSYNHALASTCSLRKFLLLGRTADCAMVAGPAGTPRFASVISRSHYLPPPPAPIAKVIARWVHKPWTAAPHLACTQIFGLAMQRQCPASRRVEAM